MKNINGSVVTAFQSQSRNASKRPQRAALALVVSLACLALNTSCLAPPRPSRALACPCFSVDPLDRVPGVATAHRPEDDGHGWDGESDAL